MYGTLIAEGALTLGILKNLNFVYLQQKTSMFVKLLIITIIQKTQERKKKKKESKKEQNKDSDNTNGDNGQDKRPLMEVFLHTHNTLQVIKGLIFFVCRIDTKTDIVLSEKEQKLIKWGCKVVVDALRVVLEGGTSSV